MSSTDTVLFLGSVTTAGSGLKKNGRQLPSDREFFYDQSPVQEQLKQGPYLALQRVGNHWQEFFQGGLYTTWNNLYLARSFSRNDLFHVTGCQVKSLLEEIRCESEERQDDAQHKHYAIQFKIYRDEFKNFPKGAPDARLRDGLFELAIWDLRVLVARTYDLGWSCNRMLKNSNYGAMWSCLKNRVGTVVNLNYDTTFEDTLKEHLGDVTICKPRGSLK